MTSLREPISTKELHRLMLEDLDRSTLTEREAKLMKLEVLANADVPYKTDVYKIPYFHINGTLANFARFRTIRPNSEAPKYQQLKDSTNLPYFEPVTKDWTAVAKDARREVNIVEGEKKAVVTAIATKIPTIGLSGTDSWRSSKKNLALLPGLHLIEWKTRRVNLCFDASNPTNPLVIHATYHLALFLRELGADVHLVFLPALKDGQTGPDDYAKMKGREALAEVFRGAEGWLGWALHDQANAERFAYTHGENLRCIGKADSESSSRWLVWDEKVWVPDSLLMRQRYAQNMPAQMRSEAIAQGADAKKIAHLNTLCSAGRITSFVKLARSIPPIPARQEDFDADRTALLLNCQNGTLELPGLRDEPVANLREHRREDLITRILRAKYDPAARCSRWERALKEWTNDKHMATTLQQLVGLSLTGLTSKHLFIIMLGDGQTGKTTFQEAILHLLAGYGGTISSDHLVLQRHNAPDERKAVKLVGLRFVSSSETKQGNTLDESFIKIITGGDTLTARRLYAEQFDFKPQAKIWLRTNHPLTIRGTDNGIWRRIVQIPFAHIVSKPDKSLPDTLRAEADGILAWAVRGWLDYVERGDLYLAPAIVKATEEYKREQDVLGSFLDDECDVGGSSYTVPKRVLYSSYKAWAERGGSYIKNEREFGSELLHQYKFGESRPIDKATGKQIKTWVGLRIKPAMEEKNV